MTIDGEADDRWIAEIAELPGTMSYWVWREEALVAA